MASGKWLVAFFVLLALAACQTPPAQDWRQQEEFTLRHLMSTLRADSLEELRLSAEGAWRLDAQRVLLIGSFRSPVGAVRSAVLISDDNGRTWRLAEAWMAGCEAAAACVLDSQRAWVVMNWSIEGHLPPYFVFRTEDGGKTWDRSVQAVGPLEGTPDLDQVTFRTPKDGEISFCDLGLKRYRFSTADGGMTWKFAAQDQGAPRKFALQTPRKGDMRVSTDYDLRLLILEEYAGNDRWQLLAYLPSMWRLRDGAFAPSTQPAASQPTTQAAQNGPPRTERL